MSNFISNFWSYIKEDLSTTYQRDLEVYQGTPISFKDRVYSSCPKACSQHIFTFNCYPRSSTGNANWISGALEFDLEQKCPQKSVLESFDTTSNERDFIISSDFLRLHTFPNCDKAKEKLYDLFFRSLPKDASKSLNLFDPERMSEIKPAILETFDSKEIPSPAISEIPSPIISDIPSPIADSSNYFNSAIYLTVAALGIYGLKKGYQNRDKIMASLKSLFHRLIVIK